MRKGIVLLLILIVQGKMLSQYELPGDCIVVDSLLEDNSVRHWLKLDKTADKGCNVRVTDVKNFLNCNSGSFFIGRNEVSFVSDLAFSFNTGWWREIVVISKTHDANENPVITFAVYEYDSTGPYTDVMSVTYILCADCDKFRIIEKSYGDIDW